MSKPTKEQVLQWYSGFKAALKEKGLDLEKPSDLMRIKVCNLYEHPEAPGSIEDSDSISNYAFIPKKTENSNEYSIPMPTIPKKIQEKSLQKYYREKTDAEIELLNKKDELKNALNNNSPMNIVEPLEDELDEIEKKLDDKHKEARKQTNEVFTEIDKWLIKNQKFFNPEEDYAQIEYLYEKAQEGLLYFYTDIKEKDYCFSQIMVGKDGNPCISNAFKDIPSRETINYTDICSKEEIREKLEKKYNKPIPYTQEIQRQSKKIKRLEKPKAPGFFDWCKRIASFGFANKAFVDYKQQKKEYDDREREIAEYEQNSETKISELREKNQANYKLIDEILHEENKQFYPENALNCGKMISMMEMIKQAEQVRDVDERFNLLDPDFNNYRRIHELELLNELKENPTSLDKEGNRNKEESEKYWNKNVYIDPADIESKNKIEAAKISLIKKSQLPYNISKNSIYAKENYDKAVKNNLYTDSDLKKSINDTYEKIGKLFSENNALALGRKVFYAIATGNQRGKDNKDCINALEHLLKIAEKPEIAKKNELTSLKELTKQEVSDEAAADSMVAIMSSLKPESSLSKTLSKALPLTVDYTKPLVEKEGKDVSLSSLKQRTSALKLSRKINYCSYGRQDELKKKGNKALGRNIDTTKEIGATSSMSQDKSKAKENIL